MPNWCYTDFTVSGPTEDITRFREAVRGTKDGVETPFDFNRLIPMPSELLETIANSGIAYDVYYGDAEPMLVYPWVKNLGIGTVEQLREHFDADPQRRATADAWKTNIEKYGAPTWYEWRCEHWDTKWNACDGEVTDIGDGSLHVQFDTAWSFPFPILETAVSAFPQLLFEGSAYEPNCDFYIKFEGRNGEFACEDDDEARKAAAAEYEEEDESQKMTA
jgi:Ferredoxin-like domain in Api92-like protein